MGEKMLNVNYRKETAVIRPRSPVGVQEWVDSLPIPIRRSSLTSNIEPISSSLAAENSKSACCVDSNFSFEENVISPWKINHFSMVNT